MSRKYFGTDGIRGKANTAPMTAETALRRIRTPTRCDVQASQNSSLRPGVCRPEVDETPNVRSELVPHRRTFASARWHPSTLPPPR